MNSMHPWPEWWNFELVISSHAVDRMDERGFSEVDLRTMLEDATGFRPSIVPGRFLVETRHESEAWEIVVEPDQSERVLVVVTAYWLESP